MQQVHATSLLFAGIIVALYAGVEAFYEARVLKEEKAVHSWPETRCTVISCEVEIHSDIHNPPDTFELHVNYRYRVESVDYEGNRYHISGNWMDGYDHAHQTAAVLLPGTEIPCYYDPVEPAVAVLSLGPRFRARQWMFSAILCFAGITAFGTGLYFKLSR